MEIYEYICLLIAIIPKDIIGAYNLQGIAVNRWVYCDIRRGIYGLPQARNIAYDKLVERLDPYV